MDNLDYGIVGNCTSAALISKTGTIEWLCLPDFDSSSEFAKILDREKGGEFGFEFADDYAIHQFYHPYTNILKTRFESGKNILEVIDFMPRFWNEKGEIYHAPELIRYVHVISGQPSFRVIYNPRLNYGISDVKTHIDEHYIKSITLNGTYESVYLYSDLPFEKVVNREEIKIDKDHFFLISYNEKLVQPSLATINLNLQRTEVYWLNWVEKGMGFRKYRKEVIRSALVLRLLTFSETGAIIAAVTTSLPETIGEMRNWDYRFCWIRDSAMIVRILRKLGYRNESRDFLNFIINITPTKDEKLQIMYGIRGERELSEHTLDHLSGYMGSKPVRVGNAAYTQRQHDIVGVLMDVIYQEFENYDLSSQRSETLWTIVRSIMMKIRLHWREPDKGIWEIRNEEQHFVFSKVLTWTAADRGVKIARLLGMEKYIEPWSELRDMIHEDVMKNGWDDEIKAFTQYYGSKNMDAANLLLEHYGFIDANDPKYISTVQRTREKLLKDGLMYRYVNEDDFGMPRSSFTICTFWMIQSLYKIGEKEEAIKMFNDLLSYSNSLGLFSEDIDFKSKRLLGNFPQGYSHLALIETALLLDMEKKDDYDDTAISVRSSM